MKPFMTILQRMSWPLLGVVLSMVIAPHEARGLDIIVDQITSTESSISFRAQHDNTTTSYSYKYCIGTLNGCSTPFLRPSFWVDQSPLGPSATKIVTINGLKPGIGYTIQLALTNVFAVAHQEEMTVYTQPGYQPAASVATVLTPNSAMFQWQSPTPGTSAVRVSANPPSWSNLNIPLNTGETIYRMTSRHDNLIFAVTDQGRILRFSGGSWNVAYVTPGANPLLWIDTSHPTYLVATGQTVANLTTIYISSDVGLSWSQLVVGAGMIDKADAIKVIRTGEFLISTNNERLFRYRQSGPTVWEEITRTGASNGDKILGIGTIDGLEIWTASTNGNIYYSSDAGSSWDSSTPPGSGGTYLSAVETLDNKTVWATGQGGKLYRKTSTTSWQRVTLGTNDHILDINLLRPDRIIIKQLDRILTVQDFSVIGNIQISDAIDGFINSIGNAQGIQIFISDYSTVRAYSFPSSTTIEDLTSVTTHNLTTTFPPGPPRIFYTAETWNSPSRTWGMGISGYFDVGPPDTEPPDLTLTQPNPVPRYVNFPNRIVRIEGVANDNQTIASMQCANMTDHGGFINVSTTPPPPPTIVGADVSLTWYHQVALGPSDGPVNFDCRVVDASGNQTTRSTQFVYDDTEPAIDFSTSMWDRIFNETPINTLPFTVDGRVTDAIGASRIEYQLNGATAVSVPVPAVSKTDWSFTFDLDTLNPGAPGVSPGNDLTVRVFDLAGNVSNTIGGLLYYVEPTFTLTATPTGEQTADLGTPLTYTVTINPVNGFTGDVNLTSDDANGLRGTFSQVTSSPPYAPVTLTVDTTGGTTGVLSTLTITGTSGSKTDSIALPIRLRTPPNYTVSTTANDPMPNILAGTGGTYSIALSANDTFNATVGLAISGVPAGVTAIFTRGGVPITNVALAPLETVSNIFLEINTTLAAVPGNDTLVLTTSAPSLAPKNFNLALNISAVPDFDLTISPASQTVTAGGASTLYQGTVTALNGFSGIVNLTFSDDPNPTVDNPNIVLSNNTSVSVVMGTPADFFLSARALSAIDCPTFPCTKPLTVTASRGALVHTQPVDLVINEDLTPPIISNIVATPDWDRVTISWETNEPTDADNIHLVKVLNTTVTMDFGDSAICTGTPCVHSVEYIGLEGGTQYEFTVRSCDTATRRNCTTATTFSDGTRLRFMTLAEPDNEPPTLNVDNPAASATPTTVVGSITMTGTANDNQTVTRVEVTAVGPSGRTFNGTQPCSSTSCAFSISWVMDETYPNGVYTLTFIAYDSKNPSTPVVRQIAIDNDFDTPQFSSGPDVEVSPGCMAGDRVNCYAIIRWTTFKETTSQVDYGTSASCNASTGECFYPHGPIYDVRAPGNPDFRTTVHEVRLDADGGAGLIPSRIYHYQVTTCNQNNKCAY